MARILLLTVVTILTGAFAGCDENGDVKTINDDHNDDKPLTGGDDASGYPAVGSITTEWQVGIGTIIENYRCVITAGHVVNTDDPPSTIWMRTYPSASDNGLGLGIRRRVHGSTAPCEDIAILYMGSSPRGAPTFNMIAPMQWSANKPDGEFEIVSYNYSGTEPIAKKAGTFEVEEHEECSGGLHFGSQTMGNDVDDVGVEVGDSGAPFIDGGSVKGVLSEVVQAWDYVWGANLSGANGEWVSSAIEAICCSRMGEKASHQRECCPELTLQGEAWPQTTCELVAPPEECGPETPPELQTQYAMNAQGIGSTAFTANMEQAFDNAVDDLNRKLDQQIADNEIACKETLGGKFKVGARKQSPLIASQACEPNGVSGFDCKVYGVQNGVCCHCDKPDPGAEQCACCYAKEKFLELTAECFIDGGSVEKRKVIVGAYDISGITSARYFRGAPYIGTMGPQVTCYSDGWEASIWHDASQSEFWEWEDEYCGYAAAGYTEGVLIDSCSEEFTTWGFAPYPGFPPFYTVKFTIRPVPDEPEPEGDPSDFDGDGDVDGNDFLAWQRGVGSSGASQSQGDANGDGIVDGNDLNTWKGNYGESE